MQLVTFFYLYLVLHAYAIRFDMTGNLEKSLDFEWFNVTGNLEKSLHF